MPKILPRLRTDDQQHLNKMMEMFSARMGPATDYIRDGILDMNAGPVVEELHTTIDGVRRAFVNAMGRNPSQQQQIVQVIDHLSVIQGALDPRSLHQVITS